MMSDWVVINYKQHKTAGWKKLTNYRFAAEPVAPVSVAEISHLLSEMPLAFSRSAETGVFQLVAVQGLRPGDNVFLSSTGHWAGQYIPACYRAHPFMVMKETSNNKPVLCMDISSEGIQIPAADDDAVRIFDSAGELTPPVSRIVSYLSAHYRTMELTRKLVAQLDDLQLMQHWPIELTTPEGEVIPVGGLFRINEQRIRELTQEAVYDLAVSGAMAIIYAQLFSQSRLKKLVNFYNLQGAAESAIEIDSIDLDEIFGENDDDIIKF
ncbi:SapC family protein [Desulfobotulus mexicanus]|nr:SapC family protein [Desulfobotulus mexicanus]